MGYQSISNLYKEQTILLFRECWALEKIHGSSAHVSWRDGRLWLSSGGESAVRFAAIFDEPALAEQFVAMGHADVTVYGEVYGGSCQKQSWRYGTALRFVAFDVQIGDLWLDIPDAVNVVVNKLGLECARPGVLGLRLEERHRGSRVGPMREVL